MMDVLRRHPLNARLGLPDQILDGLVPLVSSIQIDNNGVLEITFENDTTNIGIIMLWNLLFTEVPEANDFMEAKPLTIGYHPKDGVSYLGDSIVLSFKEPIPDDLYERYRIPRDMELKDSYKIKFDLDSKSSSIKVYDIGGKGYQRQNTPSTFYWSTMVGFGRQFSASGENSSLVDYYYLSSNDAIAREYLGDTYPESPVPTNDPEWKALSLVTDTNTGQVKLTKTYIYSNVITKDIEALKKIIEFEGNPEPLVQKYESLVSQIRV